MSDWGSESEDLFRAARRELSPRLGERDRVRAQLTLKLGAGAAAGAAALTATSFAGANAGSTTVAVANGASAVKGATVPLIAKIVGPLLVVGAVGTAAIAPRMVGAHPNTPPKPTSAVISPPTRPAQPVHVTTSVASPDDVLPAAVSLSVSDLPAAKPAATTRPSHAPREPKVASAAAGEAARDEEANLVAELDRALRSGDFTRALRLADEHERRFPDGMLVEERDGARVLARCSSSPNKAAADAFLQVHPRSPMRARVVAACNSSTER
jgi:hypothetical protein